MKSFYSLEEVILSSENNLSVNDIKYYCRIGELNPCIYFQGNLVCISDEKLQDSACKSGPVAHIEEVKWSTIFEGYIYFSQLVDYLDASHTLDSGVFYNVDKIIQSISHAISDTSLFNLADNEYLKAFPRMIDDDIKNIRWLLEAKDFEGNPFYAKNILFHHSQVDKLLSQRQSTIETKSAIPIFYKNEFFTLIEAACLIANENPVTINNAWDEKNFSNQYPRFVEAHNFILSIYHTSNLKEMDSPVFMSYELKQLLANKDIFIAGFNENINQIALEEELYELRKERIQLREEKKNLELEIQELQKVHSYQQEEIKENCLPFSGDNPDFPIELSLANFIWKEIYINKRFPQKYSHEQAINELFNSMNFEHIPLTEKFKDRLKSITTPLRLKPKDWNVFKENQKNHGHPLSKNSKGTP
ncbi:hypothetical protein GFH30_01010 [Acinetobacter wanghuae]|uniref:Uncharacterized protein n=1 Tax=Acinetobacter wanghuae TaxID=2662362 RepID=A0A5Q0NZX1_9GAMM|nr:hypothetical protein [Acinetobacter wanghuae]MQW91966.1 hypothetical protein [Acinetobacter wanghuae]QGA10064.1 hypothetical protein GFH30_01010 [Acinetobacter wanghuae]